MIILTYVDDCIIIGPSMDKIDAFVKSMQVGPKTITLTDEGNIYKFLEIEITYLDNKRFKISQLFLIDRIVAYLKQFPI